MTLARLALVTLFVATFAACATVKEAPVSTALPPMPQPEIGPGYKETVVRNGQKVTSTLVSEDGTTRSWQDSRGCSSTLPRAGFGPALVYTNCDGSSGTQKAELNGETWPLTVGKKWSYVYSGSNNRGSTWSGTRNCTVDGTVRIPTPEFGEQDTYKVSCRDHFSRYTWYVSPAQKRTVRYEQYRGDGSSVLIEASRQE